MGVWLILFLVGAGGYDAFPHYSAGVGARELSMGGAATATCDSATACYWNPAALARLPLASFSAFSDLKPLGVASVSGDMDAFVAWGMPVSSIRGGIGAAVDQFSLGGIECRTGETPNPVDTASYHETVGAVCAALNLWSGLSAGGGILVYSQNINTDVPLATAAGDFGFGTSLGLAYSWNRALRIGFSARSAAVMFGSGDRVASRLALGVCLLRVLATSSGCRRPVREDVANQHVESGSRVLAGPADFQNRCVSRCQGRAQGFVLEPAQFFVCGPKPGRHLWDWICLEAHTVASRVGLRRSAADTARQGHIRHALSTTRTEHWLLDFGGTS